jgi:hypothetical protein
MDDRVSGICARYLEIADRRVPGAVEGLYLHGSVALGDYRHGVSDIDFVAVTSRPLDTDTVRAIHAELRRGGRQPFFDGIYLGWRDLRVDPGRVAAGLSVHEWRVDPASRAERALITWHVLAQGGVAVRGPVVDWAPWLARTGRGPVGLSAWATSWGVLGVARLRHTLAAARVTSKTEAAAYARATYDPRWHRIIGEALRIRVGGAARYRNPWRRRADLVGFVDEAIRH